MTMSIGMGSQAAGERERFERALAEVLTAARDRDIRLRLLGALAFHVRCPRYGYLQAALGRIYTDLDFAAYGADAKRIQQLFTDGLGYRADEMVFVESEGARMMFDHPGHGLHVDVFFDRLAFNHIISWRGRLEVDTPTIPLAELLLEKMQIVQINKKDIIDTVMLLLEHPLGETDAGTINIKLIAHLCAEDWGLWRTVTMNLDKVKRLSAGFAQLDGTLQTAVAAQADAALARIAADPKPLRWRMRERIGDRVKWYRDVDAIK